MRRTWVIATVGSSLLIATVLLFTTHQGQHVQFLVGGALINLGYRMQDHLETFDFVHEEDITPEQVWQELLMQNRMASSVRQRFPRSARHPMAALVVCMDSRLDTNELLGDTRKYYYVIRTAGSVLAEKEEEMLELAVENGVKVVVLTTHSDCAAEKTAANPEKRAEYPKLVQAVDEREMRIHEFLARPKIASRIAAGKLLVRILDIDTFTERLLSPREHHRGTPPNPT